MSVNNLLSQKVIFKNLKNEFDGEQDSEILIPTSTIPEKVFLNKEQKITPYFSVCMKPSIVLLSIVVLLGLSASVFYSVTSVSSPKIDRNQVAGVETVSEPNGNSSKTSCLPLQPVNKVIITVAISTNHSCSNNATCTSLQEEIKKECFKYNFVIGPYFETYVGLGFQCGINGTEKSLNIKVINDDSSLLGINLNYIRISNIIEDGKHCAKIVPNYTLSSICVDDTLTCKQWCEGLYNTLERIRLQNVTHHYHKTNHDRSRVLPDDDAHRTWSGLHDIDIKETQTEIPTSKVIKLESLPSEVCLPYKPVDRILLDIVAAPPLSCTDDALCATMARHFEKQFDGLKYNFIIGPNLDLYVGLGFKCGSDGLNNTLKIKILRAKHYQYEAELMRFAEIVEQGKDCGFILENCSISSNCHIFDSNHCISHFEDLEGQDEITIRDLADNNRKDHYDDQAGVGGKIIRQHFKWMACPKKPTETMRSNSTHPVDETTESYYSYYDDYHSSDY